MFATDSRRTILAYTTWAADLRTAATRTVTIAAHGRTAITIAATRSTFIAARFAILRRGTLSAFENLAFVQPSFDADHTISGVCFGRPVIDIGTAVCSGS